AGGTQLGTATVSSAVSAGGSQLASFSWSGATRGNHVVFAVVDPDAQIAEDNEANNTASATISVGLGATKIDAGGPASGDPPYTVAGGWGWIDTQSATSDLGPQAGMAAG